MNTPCLTLGVAAVALLPSVAAPAETQRPFTASLHTWAWIDGMKVTTGGTRSQAGADLSRTNPLHPAFYASKLDGARWVATRAGPRAELGDIRNPPHPRYTRRGGRTARRGALSAT